MSLLRPEELTIINERIRAVVDEKQKLTKIFSPIRVSDNIISMSWDTFRDNLSDAGVDMDVSNISLDTPVLGARVRVDAPRIHKEYSIPYLELRAARDEKRNLQAHAVSRATNSVVIRSEKMMLTGSAMHGITGITNTIGYTNAPSVGSWGAGGTAGPLNAYNSIMAAQNSLNAAKIDGEWILLTSPLDYSRLRGLTGMENTPIKLIEENLDVKVEFSNLIQPGTAYLLANSLVNMEMLHKPITKDKEWQASNDPESPIIGRIRTIVIPCIHEPAAIARITGV